MSAMGGGTGPGPPPHLITCPSLATDSFKISKFPSHNGMVGSKCRLWICKLAKIGFLPLKFLGGMHEHPIAHISEYSASCCKVCENWFRDVEKSDSGKKEISKI